jgi:hypothetical protein
MTDKHVRYVTRQSRSHTLHLTSAIVQAQDGILTVTEAQAEEIDGLMASGKRPDIVQALLKIDEAAAAAIVKKHREEQSPAAARGTLTSAQNSPSARAALARAASTPEALAATGEGIQKPDGEKSDLKELAPKPEANGKPAKTVVDGGAPDPLAFLSKK